MTAKRSTSCIALLTIAILVSASGCIAIEPEEDGAVIGDESMSRLDDEQAAALDEALLDSFDEIEHAAPDGEPEGEAPDMDGDSVGGKAGGPEAEMRWTCTDGGTICCDNTGRCCVWGPDGLICQG